MKCKIPEISWHNRDPVLSVDIQPKCREIELAADGNVCRLASGGTDAHVLIWYISLAADGSDIDLDLAADLTRHQRAVNVVKWSPNGELLASGDDESVIFIWKQKSESDPLNVLESTNEQDKEVWITLKVLRGHMEDVYDLSWSPNSQFLVSGSVDNTAIIWNVQKGKSLNILSDHKGFVQGVAWDPRNQYIATLSTDRYLRVFDINTKRVLHRVNKATLPVPERHEWHERRLHLFHDDTLQTFFRRLCFTPDGKLLLTPAGVVDYDGATRPLHTTYVFSRYGFRQPAAVLPCPDQYAVAVRCCPLLFRLRPHNPDVNPPIVALPYRMVYAVATRSSVYFYDTQQRQPFALISNIHYTRLTDVTWSSDGRIVIVSSTDGFCSLITFESGEIGEVYEDAETVLSNLTAAEVPSNGKPSKKQKDNEQQGQETRKTPTNETDDKAQAPELIKDNEELLAKSSVAIKNEESCEDAHNHPTKTFADAITDPQSAKPFVADIMIDKEILSSDEKFESPEKKNRAATPISVRRHPRTPTTTSTLPSSHTPAAGDPLPLYSAKQQKTPQQSKRATPIAIRRTPRIVVTTPTTVVDSSTVVEEALDTWPIDKLQLSTVKPADKLITKEVVTEQQVTPQPAAAKEECTADIHLVYEATQESMPEPMETEKIETPQQDTIEAVNSPRQDQTPTNSKTPRRVALRTISTPKSKKKLLP